MENLPEKKRQKTSSSKSTIVLSKANQAKLLNLLMDCFYCQRRYGLSAADISPLLDRWSSKLASYDHKFHMVENVFENWVNNKQTFPTFAEIWEILKADMFDPDITADEKLRRQMLR